MLHLGTRIKKAISESFERCTASLRRFTILGAENLLHNVDISVLFLFIVEHEAMFTSSNF